MANGWGGKRAGAGRKKAKDTIVRDKALKAAEADAEYALGLVIGYMRNTTVPRSFRRACAVIVMDRVWGKPTQHREISGEGGGPLEVQFVNDWRNTAPISTSRPTSDTQAPGEVQTGDGGPEVEKDDDGNSPGD